MAGLESCLTWSQGSYHDPRPEVSSEFDILGLCTVDASSFDAILLRIRLLLQGLMQVLKFPAKQSDIAESRCNIPKMTPIAHS